MRGLALVLALAACSQPAEAPETQAPQGETTTSGDLTDHGEPALSPQAALAAMPSWEGARAAGVDFRAVGQEPGWLLDIYTRGIIKFAWDYGENYAEFAVADPDTSQEGATRYEASSDGRMLAVTIRRAPCQDAMSGQPYPSSVEVVIDGRTLIGCGRSV